MNRHVTWHPPTHTSEYNLKIRTLPSWSAVILVSFISKAIFLNKRKKMIESGFGHRDTLMWQGHNPSDVRWRVMQCPGFEVKGSFVHLPSKGSLDSFVTPPLSSEAIPQQKHLHSLPMIWPYYLSMVHCRDKGDPKQREGWKSKIAHFLNYQTLTTWSLI